MQILDSQDIYTLFVDSRAEVADLQRKLAKVERALAKVEESWEQYGQHFGTPASRLANHVLALPALHPSYRVSAEQLL